MSSVEKTAGLAWGSISKIVRGHRVEPTSKTYARLAHALSVDRNWLESGVGMAPTLTGVLPPRPGSEAVAGWLPGSEVVPPGTEAVAAWRPDANDPAKHTQPQQTVSALADAVGMDVNTKPKATNLPTPRVDHSDVVQPSDPYPARQTVITLAKAAGAHPATIEALLIEKSHVEDPGLDYWEGRLFEHVEKLRYYAEKIGNSGR